MAHYTTDETFLGKLVGYFTTSKLTPLFIGTALILGLFAVLVTPSEEDPQIVVPMVDIIVAVPGASAEEVESQVVKPLERLIWGIDDFPVEYVYSMSHANYGVVTARFYVNSDQQRSLVQLYDKIFNNIDKAPGGGVSFAPGSPMVQVMIKLRDINDVPQVAVTLYSENYGDYDLRRMAQPIADQLAQIPDAAEVDIIGGRPRTLRVILDSQKMAAHMTSPPQIAQVVQAANWSMPAGKFQVNDQELLVDAGTFLQNAREVGNLVVGTFQGRPVYLRDVAEIEDGPGEVDNYVLFGVGPQYQAEEEALGKTIEWPADAHGHTIPGVTITVAKKKGTNSVNAAAAVEQKLAQIRSQLIPEDVHYTFTRNYGFTAGHKADELLFHLGIATVSVILLVSVFLSWRDALVVLIAVPVVLSITLFWSWSIGYTLNRVTLFALIMSIGILVDDPIVDVENIHRHFSMRRLPPIQAIIYAVNEVRPPVILATFTVIVTLMPMAVVGGLMGPYMRPMPVNASAAMLMSLAVALMVTPWCANKFLKHYEPEPITTRRRTDVEESHADYAKQTAYYHFYQRTMGAILDHRGLQWICYLTVMVMMMAAMGLVGTKMVLVKLLPYDNKSEFSVVIDTPEGTTLEDTTRVAMELGDYLRTVNEVSDYQIYAGTASPFNFNGLVRHYFMREGSNVAEIQVNIVDKRFRTEQNHDIATRVRPALHAIADKYGARIKVLEPPPGPPNLSTLVCQIYGGDRESQVAVAKQVHEVFDHTQDVVDVDWYYEDDQAKDTLVVDDEKVNQVGLSKEMVVKTLRMAMAGMDISHLRLSGELAPVPIHLRFPVARRTSVEALKEIRLPTPSGRVISLAELVKVERSVEEKSIYHENLQRVIYVTGDVAGRNASPVYALINMWGPIQEITTPAGRPIKQHLFLQPKTEKDVVVKWDGEWHTTVETFRDMGGAFGIALLVMWVLLVGWFRSFSVPGVIMSPIAFTLVGIMPGHWLTGTWFTATSMMGMIALAGIIVRNSILVVQFAMERREEGMSMRDACIEAGALRTMPIFLTAAAVFVGAFVILLDPIFNGLATSLIWGTGASTLLSLVMVPIYLFNHLQHQEVREKKRTFKEAKQKARLRREQQAAAPPPETPPEEGPVSA